MGLKIKVSVELTLNLTDEDVNILFVAFPDDTSIATAVVNSMAPVIDTYRDMYFPGIAGDGVIEVDVQSTGNANELIVEANPN